MAKAKTINRHIARFSLRKRIHTNPQEHQEPSITYFNKLSSDHSLLNEDFERTKQIKLGQTFEINKPNKLSTTKLNPFNSTSNSVKAKTNKQLSQQKSRLNSIVQQVIGSKIKQSYEMPPQLNLNQESKKQKYLSYTQYENLVANEKILPNYFQKIAKKNDSKTIHSQILKKSRKAQKKINPKQSIVKMKIEMIEGIQAIRQKFKAKTPHLQPLRPIQMIISSNLGVLSNHSIRQKLQEKWQKITQHQTINKFIMTQESEVASDKDTRIMSVRDDSNFWSFKKKVKKQSQKQDRNRVAEFDNIQSEQQKEKLIRIFAKRQKQAFVQQNMSRGEEYQQFEQNMSKINSGYKSKKFVLKHKIQWRV